jgi:zinc/manganese transport system substrate-binding protein
MSWSKRAPFLVVLLGVVLFSACSGATSSGTTSKIQVVAAENFYGDIVKQIGGEYVTVTSILSDPNVDPHSYESNFGDSKVIADAKLVIENSGGYDSWMDGLLSASPNEQRVLLKAYDIAPTKLPDNEHIWYSIENMQAVAQQVAEKLKSLDATHASTFESNFQTFKVALGTVQQKINEIKSKHNGTPVGLTETIFLYQSGPLGLNVLTPEAFQKAVAEANDPPASAAATAEDQVRNKQVKVLIYNEQTSDPATRKLRDAASAVFVPIVPVTETMPKNKNYQGWMLDQLNDLAGKLG